MKRILFISAFPPSNIGPGVKYSMNLLADLRGSYDVDLFFFDNKLSECKIEYAKKIRNSMLLKLLRCFVIPLLHPFFTARFSIPVLLKIRKISINYDAIYFDFSQVFIYSIFIRHKIKFLMAHDIIYQNYLRRESFLNSFEKAWIKFSEKLILSRSNSKIIVFSQKDAILLKEYYTLKDSLIVDFYINEEIRLAFPNRIDDYFCFFAGWNRSENVQSLTWFFDNVLPKLSREIKFVIIGPSLPIKLKITLNKFTNISYLGFMENPYPTISRAKALIAPIFRGAGVKVKCLEALLCGIPIIGTTVAFEGIDNELLSHCIVANTPIEYLSSINTLDDYKYDRLAWKNRIGDLYPKRLFINYLNRILD